VRTPTLKRFWNTAALAAVFMLAACATVPEARVESPAKGELPWSAAELKASTRKGQKWSYVAHLVNKRPERKDFFDPRPHRTAIEIGDVDEAGFTVTYTDFEQASGNPMSQDARLTWEQRLLQLREAMFGTGESMVTRETVEVPAGRFDCWLYEFERKDADLLTGRNRLWLVRKMPGVLAKMEISNEEFTIITELSEIAP
jgi:hypothetical protein